MKKLYTCKNCGFLTTKPVEFKRGYCPDCQEVKEEKKKI